MKKIIVVIAIASFATLTSCKHFKAHFDQATADTSIQKTIVVDKVLTEEEKFTKKVDTIAIKTRSQFLGVWTELGKEELTVEITKETFYYREHKEKWKYNFNGDTVRIFRLWGTQSGRPYFINDTLLLLNADGGGFKFIRLIK
jgi:hypothetical protein